MSVEKARGALQALADMNIDEVELDKDGLLPLQVADEFNRTLRIAAVQADIAQAEALERIADLLEAIPVALATKADGLLGHYLHGSR